MVIGSVFEEISAPSQKEEPGWRAKLYKFNISTLLSHSRAALQTTGRTRRRKSSVAMAKTNLGQRRHVWCRQ